MDNETTTSPAHPNTTQFNAHSLCNTELIESATKTLRISLILRTIIGILVVIGMFACVTALFLIVQHISSFNSQEVLLLVGVGSAAMASAITLPFIQTTIDMNKQILENQNLFKKTS